MSGNSDEKELVDLTELSDTEDDLVVCRVSLADRCSATPSVADSQSSARRPTSFQSPHYHPPPPPARLDQSVADDFHRAAPFPPFHPFGVTGLRPRGGLTSGHHRFPSFPIGRDFSPFPSAGSSAMHLSLNSLNSTPMSTNSPFQSQYMHAVTAALETPFHHPGPVAQYMNSLTSMRDTPHFRCAEAMRQAREAPLSNDQRRATTPGRSESAAFPNRNSHRSQHGRVASMIKSQSSHQGERNSTERQVILL